MAEYIDRDELLKKQYNASRFSLPQFAEMVVDVQDIEDEPAADVALVKRGKWYWVTEDLYQCGNCGDHIQVKEIMGKPDWHYCPHCGAYMGE